jgi:adenylosuccinate synthase
VDVLSGLPKIKMCVEYKINNERVGCIPPDLESFGQIEPVYETVDGWESLPEKINSIDECPAQLKTFIKKIEETTGNHISLISYGPDRNQTFKL